MASSTPRHGRSISTKSLYDPKSGQPKGLPFDFLLDYDTHFLIDDSQNMFGDNWKTAQDALLAAASFCTKHDTDGFSVSFLHHDLPTLDTGARGYTDIQSEAAVQSIFKEVRTVVMDNSKPTAERLTAVLDEYFTSLNTSLKNETYLSPDMQELMIEMNSEPLKVIIITNGIPTDDIGPPLALSKRHSNQVSIEIWQVGKNAPATNFFYKTGRLRPMPSLSADDSQHGPRWKYDHDDLKKRGPSSNFLKYMGTNLLESRFMRTR